MIVCKFINCLKLNLLITPNLSHKWCSKLTCSGRLHQLKYIYAPKSSLIDVLLYPVPIIISICKVVHCRIKYFLYNLSSSICECHLLKSTSPSPKFFNLPAISPGFSMAGSRCNFSFTSHLVRQFIDATVLSFAKPGRSVKTK